MIEDMKQVVDNSESQIIHHRNDIRGLSQDIESLKVSVDESMVPWVDDNVLGVVVAIFGAFTLCLVVCQLLIFYTSRNEVKKEERRRIMVEQRKRKLDII
tara:strand:+ start:60 stop:359 length:300 start_codon:yes stop_codon:yes gene_type:complete